MEVRNDGNKWAIPSGVEVFRSLQPLRDIYPLPSQVARSSKHAKILDGLKIQLRIYFIKNYAEEIGTVIFDPSCATEVLPRHQSKYFCRFLQLTLHLADIS